MSESISTINMFAAHALGGYLLHVATYRNEGGGYDPLCPKLAAKLAMDAARELWLLTEEHQSMERTRAKGEQVAAALRAGASRR
jgi:hypothetical protein